MPLQEVSIRQAKPRDKAYKLSDGRGLHLLVNPSGSKLWRLQYRHAGKQKMLALGAYPETSLKSARQKCDDARKLIAEGRDPSAEKKAERRRVREEAANSFEAVAREFVDAKRQMWSEGHADYVIGRLEHDVFPALGKQPIAQIEAPDLLDVIRVIEARGAIEMAHRIRSFCSQIFRYGIATSRCKRDPAGDLRGALVTRQVKHMAAVELSELPGLLQRIDGCEEAPFCRNRLTRIYLQIAVLTFVRPSELRKAFWDQFDFADRLWTVPAGVMKMRRPHLVPLASQTIQRLEELKELTGSGRLLFPGEGAKGLMSENTGSYALHALGYKGRQTVHGFRGLASTILNEAEFNPDWIEIQLAHKDQNKVRKAYNHAGYLDQRTRMMQWYADYLDRLRTGKFIKPGKVAVPFRKDDAA